MKLVRKQRESHAKQPLAELPLDVVESAKVAGLRYVTGAGPGIIRQRRGKSFQYIGVDRKPVRDEETLARIKSLVIPPAWEEVWICPLANGHLQAVGRDAKGRKQYRYHPAYRQIRNETKFGRMIAFGEVLPKIRQRLSEDLKTHGLTKTRVLAAVVSLMDLTCIRVGNEEYARDNDSYGLTTMHDEHVQIHGGEIRFQFRGKSGQDHDIHVTDKRLAKIVKQCRDIDGYELFQYYNETGEHCRITSTDVNNYLHEITGQHFTAKDFRTWHGTREMTKLLKERGRSETATAAKKILNEAVKETAAKLGNRPATCRKYYIHPAVMDFYTDHSLFEIFETPCSRTLLLLNEEEHYVLSIVEKHCSKAEQAGHGHRPARKKADNSSLPSVA